MSEALALKEYVQRQREERARLTARVRRAAQLDPDLPLCLLRERFGLTVSELEKMLIGIPREKDGFSRWLGKHPKRRTA